jgi:Alpha-N-acetylglucosaminidase (NAGLU) C-terminal domain
VLQITLWGPDGNIDDYAAKAWAGLYRDYYALRWHEFIGTVVKSVAANKAVSESASDAAQLKLGRAFCEEKKAYPLRGSGSTQDAMRHLVDKYGKATGLYGKYSVVKNRTIKGASLNLQATWTRDTAQLSFLCSATPSCVAFSSAGWLFQSGGGQIDAPGVDLYVRSSL